MLRAQTLAVYGLMVVVCALTAPRASARTYIRAQATPAQAPFSLTAADGAGLRLVSLRARVVVDGPLAFTELHLTFRNPQNRQREGRFNITLPPTAAISRFAMKVDGRWQEGEVVERQRARRIYESYLHVRRDPALLEKKAGNAFRARIFPIAARANKELRISYSEELVDTARPYRLRLRGLPRIGRVQIRAQVHRRVGRRLRWRHSRLSRRRYFPHRDFTLAVASDIGGLRYRDLAVLRVKPRIPASSVPLNSLLILFDTSASRAPGFHRQVARLGSLVRALRKRHGDRFSLRVAAFDQDIKQVYAGQARGFSKGHLKRLQARGALGASNLEAALGWAARQQGTHRLLLVTDGVATAGRGGTALNRALRRARQRIRRLDVIAAGGIRDEPRLRDLVTGVLPQDGVVLDEDLSAQRLAQRLSQSVRTRVRVTVDGARWVWPRHLGSLQPGSAALIYVKLPIHHRGSSKALTVQLSGHLEQTRRVSVYATQRPLLERAWVGSRMRWLSTLGDNVFLRSQIVDLSKRYRVLSDLTALLVLETAADYRTHNLHRGALSDILTVGRRGVVLKKRSRRWVRRHVRSRRRSRGGVIRKLNSSRIAAGPGRRPPPQRKDFWNLAFGDRSRALTPSVAKLRRKAARRRISRRRARRPMVYTSRTVVVGGLDASTLRRTIRLQLPAVRHCYQTELQSNPHLQGTVKLTFTILKNGRVGRAVISASSLNNQTVEACILKLTRRWQFSQSDPALYPYYSMPQVTYPFHFINRSLAQKPAAKAPPAPKARPAPRARTAPKARPAPAPPRPRRVVRTLTPAPPKPAPLPSAYSGELLRIKKLLRAGKARQALARARSWRARHPGSLLALIGLGESLQRLGRLREATRVYGSIIDLFPSRAELRRYAGNRLAALGSVGLRLARDTYAKAVTQRPDHPHGYRLLAFTQVRLEQPLKALKTLEAGLSRSYPSGRFAGAKRVLRADLGIVARVLVKSRPRLKPTLQRRLARSHAKLARWPSQRAVLTWETDANDMDIGVSMGTDKPVFSSFYYRSSAYDLFGNVTNGFGPEAIVLKNSGPRFQQRLYVRYTSRGPMGYGLGTVQVLRHDGRGGLRFDDRPFVIMKQGATVPLGTL